MIPGPIEFDPEVLAALGAPTTSHIAPDFIETFGMALDQLRQVFGCPAGQPFVLAGSGTLAMDSAAANLVEPGDRALVIQTGYFSDRFAAILERYGAQVTIVHAPPGCQPALEEVQAALESNAFKLMTITQVDTSTGVLADVRALAALARRYGILCLVDGVCSVAGEELPMSEWGVDLALSASQKAIGVPPGLALIVAGERAMQAFRERKNPVLSYYGDWGNWLPVMESYAACKAAYFATPPVNLAVALRVSLGQILQEGLAARVLRHRAISRACKAGITALGLEQVPDDGAAQSSGGAGDSGRAHTMTAPRFPTIAGFSGVNFLQEARQAGVILAGGLHPAIRTEYFRIGHMGAVCLGDVLATLSAIERALAACGISVEPGSSLAAAQAAYVKE